MLSVLKKFLEYTFTYREDLSFSMFSQGRRRPFLFLMFGNMGVWFFTKNTNSLNGGSLFSDSRRFMLDEMFQQNTSKLAIFLNMKTRISSLIFHLVPRSVWCYFLFFYYWKISSRISLIFLKSAVILA